MPRLLGLTIADASQDWRSIGFSTEGDSTAIGSVGIRLDPSAGRGIVSWSFADLHADVEDLDGVPVEPWEAAPNHQLHPSERAHPNQVERLDHVVMFTPDLGRTRAALEAAGFEARRERDVPGSEPPRRQVFFWAGDTIIELVGPVTAEGGDPARLWGLALTVTDIDRAAEQLGPRLGPVKDAVQQGRRIATVRTREAGVSVPIALLSPHA